MLVCGWSLRVMVSVLGNPIGEMESLFSPTFSFIHSSQHHHHHHHHFFLSFQQPWVHFLQSVRVQIMMMCLHLWLLWSQFDRLLQQMQGLSIVCVGVHHTLSTIINWDIVENFRCCLFFLLRSDFDMPATCMMDALLLVLIRRRSRRKDRTPRLAMVIVKMSS